MPRITAMLHTENDELRLGRALETLYPCDEIVIVDHGSIDETIRVAKEYGATILGLNDGDSIRDTLASWIFCMDPRESLTEALAASLFEWKSDPLPPGVSAFSVFLREETAEGWVEHPAAQARLVPPNWNRWKGYLPSSDSSAIALEGELLRFAFP